jgi:cob(I)alamin adenosyltransferase
MPESCAREAVVTSAEEARDTGYVHVYTGEGKGKTTAAMGLALRALGHQRRVFIGQFMKTGASGEVAALSTFSHVDVEGYGHDDWLFGKPGNEHRRRAHTGFSRSLEALASGRYDVVILDEIDVALSFGLLTVPDCLALLDRRPTGVELVLTGRSAPREITERADLVTEMREVKHYYRRGVIARAGIEY